jgi:hypothetical protein
MKSHRTVLAFTTPHRRRTGRVICRESVSRLKNGLAESQTGICVLVFAYVAVIDSPDSHSSGVNARASIGRNSS